MASYIGMDFGGTKLLVGEVNADGQLLGKKKYTTGYVNQEAAVATAGPLPVPTGYATASDRTTNGPVSSFRWRNS